VNAVLEIITVEAGPLIHHPQRRGRRVLGCSPCRYGLVEVLDLLVNRWEGDDLRDLVRVHQSIGLQKYGITTRETHNNPHHRIARPHLIHQLPERRENLLRLAISAKDVVGPEVHGDNVGRVLLQPVDQLVLGRNIDRQEAGVLRRSSQPRVNEYLVVRSIITVDKTDRAQPPS